MYYTLKLKNILKVISINIIILIIISYAIDIIFFDERMPIQLAQYHPDLDIITLKGNDIITCRYKFYKIPYKKIGTRTYKIITDQDGCRIGSKREIKYNNNNNIVVLGDSYSFGAHADYENTIPGLLEKHYHDCYIWNFSVCGTSSSYYDRILSYYMGKKKITPKILLVGIYVDMQIGDIPRVLAKNKFGSYRTINGIVIGPSLFNTLQNSFFHRLLFNANIYLRNKTSLINILFPRKQPADFALSLMGNLKQTKLPSLENMLLANINNIWLKSKISPENIIIWFVPSDHELYHKIIKDQDNDNFYKISREFWDNIKKTLIEKGYHVIDPRDEIDNLFLQNNIYPYTVDGHFNENGFKYITQMLIKEIDKIHQ